MQMLKDTFTQDPKCLSASLPPSLWKEMHDVYLLKTFQWLLFWALKLPPFPTFFSNFPPFLKLPSLSIFYVPRLRWAFSILIYPNPAKWVVLFPFLSKETEQQRPRDITNLPRSQSVKGRACLQTRDCTKLCSFTGKFALPRFPITMSYCSGEDHNGFIFVCKLYSHLG